MKKNLESTGGLIFSGQLLLDLAEAGMMREEAYRLVQSHAMRAWKEDLNFREEVTKDPAIAKLLTPESWRRRLTTPASSATSTQSSSACWESSAFFRAVGAMLVSPALQRGVGVVVIESESRRDGAEWLTRTRAISFIAF